MGFICNLDVGGIEFVMAVNADVCVPRRSYGRTCDGGWSVPLFAGDA